ncbi:MAG TPA: diaminopimelate epimerase [Firmicutes bacterium]|jgi:diaminopimelate epimerase|nr:diaminopimelate epimerase [Bacillota bacterium]
MRFTKMHGLGNDYLFVYGEPENPQELSIKLSDRHFGVGSDGMVWISPSVVADFKMRIFNADGSEAKMCGNGIRCIGKYVYDKGYTTKTELKIETLSGVRTLRLEVENGQVKSVAVEMGVAMVQDDLRLTVEDMTVWCTPVSVGNPHVVIFVPDINQAPLTTLGPKLERHEAFPEGVNVEFVQVLDERTLRMRVWERGSGVTMACGTGACASTVAAINKGCCPYDEQIAVQLDGGILHVRVAPDKNVTMLGPAETVCEGETV